MHVEVLFFGVLTDLTGRKQETVALPENATVHDLVERYIQRFPELKSLASSIATSVNQEYTGLDHGLRDGDEIAFLPPVSGGSESRVRIVRAPIDTQAVLSAIKRPEDGAAVVFEGVVRDNTRGRRTLYLDYEAYEVMALKQMEALVTEAMSRYKVREVALVHRLGRLEIGEASVLIVVASAHRGDAFEACRWLIDTLKRTVPIWKKEHFEDGTVWADGEPFPAEVRTRKAPIQEGLPSK